MKDYNILVIDDEAAQRDVLTGYLKKNGYKIFSASSGREGIEIAGRNPVDIILSVFKMPDLNGIVFL